MSVIVKDTGFTTDDWSGDILDLSPDANLKGHAEDIGKAKFVRIDFPSFGDGRGFTLARQLRQMGFSGRLRAKGQIISQQYAMARRSGFDEIEISEKLAKRQPEEQWLARADWAAHDYQSKLRDGDRHYDMHAY